MSTNTFERGSQILLTQAESKAYRKLLARIGSNTIDEYIVKTDEVSSRNAYLNGQLDRLEGLKDDRDTIRTLLPLVKKITKRVKSFLDNADCGRYEYIKRNLDVDHLDDWVFDRSVDYNDSKKYASAIKNAVDHLLGQLEVSHDTYTAYKETLEEETKRNVADLVEAEVAKFKTNTKANWFKVVRTWTKHKIRNIK